MRTPLEILQLGNILQKGRFLTGRTLSAAAGKQQIFSAIFCIIRYPPLARLGLGDGEGGNVSDKLCINQEDLVI
ncbi:hypothetical protein ES703_119151 [subsurface metagenome]